jgi:hypothetical protein
VIDRGEWKHIRFERIPDVAPVIEQRHGPGYGLIRHAYREIQARYWTDESGQKWGETRVSREGIG